MASSDVQSVLQCGHTVPTHMAATGTKDGAGSKIPTLTESYKLQNLNQSVKFFESRWRISYINSML